MSNKPLVSIIINIRNTYDYLGICLSSIMLHTDPKISREIILVDGSTDGYIKDKELKLYQKAYKYVDNRRAKGIETNYGVQQNLGASVAEGEFLVFLNEDTVVHKNWLTLLLKDYELLVSEGLKVGMIGARADNISAAQNIVWLADRNKILPLEANRIITTCALIKKSVFEEVGRYDEELETWNYHDDDLSLRLTKAGYKLVVSRAYISHFMSSATQRAGIDVKADLEKGKEYIINKHPELGELMKNG